MLVMLMSPATPLFAHPGHDHPIVAPHQPAHWIVEPQHAAIWVGTAMVVWMVVRAMRGIEEKASKVAETQR